MLKADNTKIKNNKLYMVDHSSRNIGRTLGSEYLENFCNIFGNNPRFGLNLNNNGITVDWLKDFAEILMHKNIKSLNLSNNDFGDEGIKILAAVLYLSGLEELVVINTGITMGGKELLEESAERQERLCGIKCKIYITKFTMDKKDKRRLSIRIPRKQKKIGEKQLQLNLYR